MHKIRKTPPGEIYQLGFVFYAVFEVKSFSTTANALCQRHLFVLEVTQLVVSLVFSFRWQFTIEQHYFVSILHKSIRSLWSFYIENWNRTTDFVKNGSLATILHTCLRINSCKSIKFTDKVILWLLSMIMNHSLFNGIALRFAAQYGWRTRMSDVVLFV